MMPSLDAIFAKEFKAMSQQRAAYSGTFALGDLSVPSFPTGIDKQRRVLIRGITEQYYEKLNDEEPIYWAKPNLKRRKFGAEGRYLTDKTTGKVIVEEVPLTQGCIAVISQRRIGVPLAYKPSKPFQFVDCIKRTGSNECSFVYIIPKEHCYLLKQCALVISLSRLRSYYAGLEVVLQSGHTIYVYVTDYNPLRESTAHRVLCTKTSCNFSNEFNLLLSHWQSMNMVFDRSLTELTEPINGRMNVAYQQMCASKDEFMRFDPSKSLADTGEDMAFSDMF